MGRCVSGAGTDDSTCCGAGLGTDGGSGRAGNCRPDRCASDGTLGAADGGTGGLAGFAAGFLDHLRCRRRCKGSKAGCSGRHEFQHAEHSALLEAIDSAAASAADTTDHWHVQRGRLAVALMQRATLGAVQRTSHCRRPALMLQWLMPAPPEVLLVLTLVLLLFSTTSEPTLVLVLVLVLTLELLLTLLLDVIEAAIAAGSVRHSSRAALGASFMASLADLPLACNRACSKARSNPSTD